MNSIKSFLTITALAFTSFAQFAHSQSANFDGGASSPREIIRQIKDADTAPETIINGTETNASPSSATGDDIQRYIIRFEKGTPAMLRRRIALDAGANITHDLRIIDALAIWAPNSKAAALTLKLAHTPGVTDIEEDRVQSWLNQTALNAPAVKRGWPWPRPNPKPPENGDQKTPWGIDRVQAPKAWKVTRGKGVKVAVIDTGIDPEHPDMRVLGGYNAVDPALSFKDDHGHGSHVAGTIAALDNGKGVVGVAPEASLYGVKVLDASGRGTYAAIIAGIQWAAENGMVIANMSLGGSQGTAALQDSIRAANAMGMTIIAAAGNNGGKVGYPAAYPETITIAAAHKGDGIASFSSRGPEIDFISPGVDIPSTFKNGGYKTLSGTSMASPHAAGLAALAVAAKGVSGFDAIKAALAASTRRLEGLPDTQQGAGFIDAVKIVSGR